MKKEVRKFCISLLLFFFFIAGLTLDCRSSFAEESSSFLYTLSVEGTITPFTWYQIKHAISRAEKEGASCLILLLDTPGGLLASTRKIVQEIFASKVPVISYVAPQGAQCASAGTFILLASHIAAMAPATNVGAASPVSIEGDIGKTMEKKAMNDTVSFIQSIARQRGRNAIWAEKAVTEASSITSSEALSKNVIDCVATDIPDLLHRVERISFLSSSGKKERLSVKGAEVREITSGLTEKLLRVIGEPHIAYILMMIGIWGIIIEFSHPGFGVPGIVGTIALILAFFAFQTFTQSIAGLLLVIVGTILFLVEIFSPGFGLFAISGLISLGLGSLMLLRGAGSDYVVSPFFVATFLVASALLLWGIFSFLAVTRRRKVATGNEGMIGEIGRALTSLSPEGMVFVRGEYWTAFSDTPIPEGSTIEVVALSGLRLKVVQKGDENVS
ncbi:MAG: nodulation protein NfeD [Candidatus Ratteibacteria bacterium]|jgi:membrane-bound serine protease (ClpP class)